jgi:hypothetical protein
MIRSAANPYVSAKKSTDISPQLIGNGAHPTRCASRSVGFGQSRSDGAKLQPDGVQSHMTARQSLLDGDVFLLDAENFLSSRLCT